VGVTVAKYHRVSTDKQNLARQTTATSEYVSEHFPDRDVRVYADADTGTNTDRTEYQEMMEAIEAGEIDIVVVKEMSRVARSVRDLMKTVDRIRDNGVALHFIEDPITVAPDDDDPTQDLMLQVLGAVAEFEAKITQQRVREGIAARKESDEYHHGPAPLGFEKDDGVLVEATNYERVCAVLEMVADDDVSQREASKRLECGRKTVRRAINENPELYGLS
jgi:DNA invertase Pin-like site-specific DNA recombinase